MAEEKLAFQAEVSRLLDIVAHSLYSEKEIFLRELISNASDACDRLRYAALTEPHLIAEDPDLKVAVTIDRKARTITVADNGIGMNREDLVENLGTIARSGTAAFLSQVPTEKAQEVSLIGQFGVGFYSAFMVAEKVEVFSRKAGEEKAWRWCSEGQGSFTVAECESEAPARGTRVVLLLRKSEKEFLEPDRLRRIIKTYSDHVGLPVVLEEGEKSETVNTASALWARPRSEITEDQYREFYRHVAHAADEPWLTLHWRAEGKLEYRCLLFVPKAKPFDLFMPERKPRLKLYVKRVFITETCDELIPPYLRFLKGVVDSEDLPLNISREMLQNNPVLSKIRAGIVKRVLSELQKKAGSDAQGYLEFWGTFGAVLKEGIYEDLEQREALLKLVRFRSTAGEGWVSLADYVGRMKPGQDAIYTLSGDEAEALRKSPHLEGFLAKGVEVLLLTDPVDEFWIPSVGTFEGRPFRSVTRGAADLSKIEGGAEQSQQSASASGGPEIDRLIALLKLTLKDAVKDVRRSDRLTDSPVVLVADEHDLDIHLERLLRQHRQLDSAAPRILEINPAHPLIAGMAKAMSDGGADAVTEAAWLLLDQARILDGEPPSDPAGFARRLSRMLERGLIGGASPASGTRDGGEREGAG